MDTSVFLMDTTGTNPAESVKHLMDEAGFNILSLANATGIPRTTLKRRLVDPGSFKAWELHALAQVFDVKVADLFEKDTVPA